MNQLIEVDGSESRLDQHGSGAVLNTLPSACNTCDFPDLDFIPCAYMIARTKSLTPAEVGLAEAGNLLVRDRVRRIIEATVPTDCTFHPTIYSDTREATPWWLLVPVNLRETHRVDPDVKRCDACGRPRRAHPGTHYVEKLWDGRSLRDILKGATFYSAGSGWHPYLPQHLPGRPVFFSIRLFALLEALGVKGADRPVECRTMKAESHDLLWVDAALARIDAAGIPRHPAGVVQKADLAWLRRFLKPHSKTTAHNAAAKAVEKRLGRKLPKSYLDFVGREAPRVFADVDGESGYDAQVMLPAQLDDVHYRKGTTHVDLADPESQAIDGLAFVALAGGDVLCFDIGESRHEWKVVRYVHEMSMFEDFAPNFAVCLRRLSGSNTT